MNKISIGQRIFRTTYGLTKEHIIAQVGQKEVCIIVMDDGNRFLDPIQVNSVRDITPAEFSQMSGDKNFFDIHGNAVGQLDHVKIEISEDYTAEVYADKVKVGCQTIPIEIVKEIVKQARVLKSEGR